MEKKRQKTFSFRNDVLLILFQVIFVLFFTCLFLYLNYNCKDFYFFLKAGSLSIVIFWGIYLVDNSHVISKHIWLLISMLGAFIFSFIDYIVAICIFTSAVTIYSKGLFEKFLNLISEKYQTNKIIKVKKTGELKEIKKETNNKEVDSYQKIKKYLRKKILKDKKVDFAELAILWLSSSEHSCNKKEETPFFLPVTDKYQENSINNTKDYEILENESLTTNPPQKVDQKEKTKQIAVVQQTKEETVAEEKEPKEFKNVFVRKIYKEFILNVLDKNKFKVYYETSQKLLEILDKIGEQPSISSHEEDEEETYVQNSYDLLKQITLAEHTYNVTKEAFELTQEEFGDTYIISWPSILLAAIAHDLGKSSDLNQQTTGFYGSHARISGEIFNQCSESLYPEQKRDIFDAIIYHHGETKNLTNESILILKILKEADQRARQKEFKKLIGTIKTFETITTQDFCHKLWEIALKEMEKGQVRSFSFILSEKEGLIYFLSKIIILSLRELSKEKKIFWPDLFSGNEKVVQKAIVSFLRNHEDILPSSMCQQLTFEKFFLFKSVFIDNRPQGRKPLVPIILNVFAKNIGITPEEIVERVKDSAFYRLSI